MSDQFRIGDTAWCVSYGIKEKVRILEIEDGVAKCKADIGFCWKRLDDLYKTEQDCIDDIISKSNALKDKYRKEIKSIEDLVLFMFKHDVSNCEYQDYEAKAVAIEKAKELLNIAQEQIDNI